MANSFFEFKEFTVHQDKCAMKVCTDACVFGAWLSARAKSHGLADGAMLDVGAGTGLLSLMMAQQTHGPIDALEIEPNAFGQADFNFNRSPWPHRLTAIHADALDFIPERSYDLVFSNPPFYENDLRSPDETRNIALHGSALRMDALTQLAKRALSAGGWFGVLLPFRRAAAFESMARENGFYPVEEVLLRQTRRHAPFRAMYLCALAQADFNSREIVIREDDNGYTDAFRGLMGPYYLRL